MKRLPLLLSNNNALGVAVKSYLEELIQHPDPTSAEAKASVKTTAQEYWFPKCINVVEDLATAFSLWDAVSSIKAYLYFTLVNDCDRYMRVLNHLRIFSRTKSFGTVPTSGSVTGDSISYQTLR